MADAVNPGGGLMKGVAVVIVAAAVAGVAPIAAADAALVAKGKVVFDGTKPACKTCHNEKRNALDNYGASGSAADVKAWLRTPKQMLEKTGRKGPKPAFGADKISDADLEALTAYLLSLKKP
jgi:mono/diheme cytochrome c family protein